MKVYQLVGEIADFDYVSETFGFRICGPASLKKFLADCAEGEKVEIEINSPGGFCVPGMEMANAIKNSKAHVIAHVTGMAASMASVIACACREIRMEEASFMMIHDPWSWTEGNAAAMRKEAQNLDQFKAVIMSFYRGKFNRTEEELSALMSDETWMTGAECVENGLKCELIKSDLKMAALVGSAKFGKMPEAAAKLYKFQELTDDAKAELEKAKAEQHKPAAGSVHSQLMADYLANPDADRSAADFRAIIAELDAEGFAARFKGASKKINELQDQLKAKDEELKQLDAKIFAEQSAKDAVADELETANGKIKDLEGKLEQSDKDLKDAKASVSSLTTELEKVKKDLTQMGEQAKHLKEVNDTITGGVLVPSAEGGEYEAKMKKAKSAREREDLRALKKAGKIK